MVKYLIGEKGTGKTKKLIEIANTAAHSTDGNLVFIDDDPRHMYSLHRSVRFVETTGYHLVGYSEFLGFICGILSQNSDIVEIFIDGLTNIVGPLGPEEFISFTQRLEELSKENSVEFIITNNMPLEAFPKELGDRLM